ncbi:MAG: hypothetical protein IPP69_12090 [Flavobacteriales bacterium]|nr:hypothetical protein [Flavobacteriales bacterium]
MTYQLSNLVSVVQCDTYLQEVTDDINDLNIDIVEVQTNITTNSSLATIIPSQVTTLQEILAQQEAALAAETDTSMRRKLTLQINGLENKLIRLQKRQENLAGTNILDKQFKIALYEADLAALTEFKTALETRKTEIESSASAA